MSTSRADLAVPLLLQSPPGQVNNVYEDLIGLITCEEDVNPNDKKEFEKKSENARQEYNLEQLVVVDLPENKGNSILSKSSIHIGEGQSNRFISPRNKISFKIDHSSLKTSDPKPYKENKHIEPLREELEKQLSKYVADRYATGVVEVVAVPLPRQVIPVKKEVLEEAKEIGNTLPADEEAGTVSTSAADAEKVTEETKGETEGVKEETEMKDDPVQVVDDMEKVESESGVLADEEVKKDATEEQDTQKDQLSQQEKPQETEAVVKQEDEETQGDTKIVIHIVANKYKLSNFWSGRWRSSYTLESSESNEIEAKSSVHIHYFEDGNVQLHTNKSHSLSIQHNQSINSYASSIVKAIEKFEEEYQQELFKHSSNLSEGAFRALRRQLPMTRQKIDWDKVLNYKLGNELSKQ